MKFMLLIYSNPANWQTLSQEARDGLMGEYFAFSKEIRESGEYLDGDPLGDPSTARTVTVRGGATQAIDGPFVEAKEHLAGYYLVDCKDVDRAVELAARIPDARFNAVEVRPVMDMGGTEM